MQNKNSVCDEVQTHTHEFQGSTMLATVDEITNLLHNHRFAGVTSQVKPIPDNPNDHTHNVSVTTDFFFNHFHQIALETGPVILILDPNTNKPIGHTHAIVGTSSRVFCHEHDFKTNTLIQHPIMDL